MRFVFLGLILPLALLGSGMTLDFEVSVDGHVTKDVLDLRFEAFEGWDRLVSPDLEPIVRTGAPFLPKKTIYVAFDGKAGLSGLDVEIDRVPLDGAYRLLPTHEPRRTSDTSPIEFVPDEEIYGSSSLYPINSATLIGQANLYGQRIAIVEVYPFQYRPSDGTLVFNRRIDVRLKRGGGSAGPESVGRLAERHRPLIESMIEDRVMNPWDVDVPKAPGVTPSRDLHPGDYDYVIITPPEFFPAFEPLIEWKTRKGKPAKLVSVNWIEVYYGGSTDADRVRNFVIDANETWGAMWFLLGGDAEQVPYHVRNYVDEDIPTDLPYSDLNDDWVAEVFVGRASVESSSDVEEFVDKVITYETDPPLGDYALSCLLLGFDLDSLTPTEQMKDQIDAASIPPRFDPIDKVYDSHAGNHHDEAMAALQTGPHIVNHADHAWWTVIGTGSRNHGWHIDISDARSLENGDRLSILYSMGCWSCAFDEEDAIGEEFVQNPNGGCVGYIGNSRSGWYNPGTFNTLSNKLDQAFFKSLFQENNYYLGQALSDSKNDNYPDNDWDMFVHCALTLVGCPELPVWLDEPTALEADHPDTIPVGTQEVTVTVTSERGPVEGARVCLYKGDEVYGVETTSGDGTAAFTVSPHTHGALHVTVTKQNHFPYVDSTYVEGVLPTCDFEGEPLSGVQPLEVAFSDLSNGSIDAWSWDFGDASTDSARHPVHVYDTAGTFDVSLAVDGPYGSGGEVKPGYVTVTAPEDTAWLSADETGDPAMREIEAHVGDTLAFHMNLANHADSAHSVMFPVRYDAGALELLDLGMDTSAFPTPVAWSIFELDTVIGDTGKAMLYAWTSAYAFGLPRGSHHLGEFSLFAGDTTGTPIDTCGYPPEGHLYYSDGRSGEDYWPYFRPVQLSVTVQNPDSAWLSLNPSGDPMLTELDLYGEESTELSMMMTNLSDSAHSVMYPLYYDVDRLELLDLSYDSSAFPVSPAWNLFWFDTTAGDSGKLMIYGWTSLYSVGIPEGTHRIGLVDLQAVMPDSDSAVCVIDTCMYPPAGHLYYTHGPSAGDYWPDWFPVTVTLYRAMCGDANGDGEVTSGDGFHVLNYLGGGPPISSCWASNVDGVGTVSPADGFHLLNYLGVGPDLDCAPCVGLIERYEPKAPSRPD
jgi:PKD repeat protein